MGHYNSCGCYSTIENHQRILNRGVRVVKLMSEKAHSGWVDETRVEAHRSTQGEWLRSECKEAMIMAWQEGHAGGGGCWSKATTFHLCKVSSGPLMYNKVTIINNKKIIASMA